MQVSITNTYSHVDLIVKVMYQNISQAKAICRATLQTPVTLTILRRFVVSRLRRLKLTNCYERVDELNLNPYCKNFCDLLVRYGRTLFVSKLDGQFASARGDQFDRRTHAHTAKWKIINK